MISIVASVYSPDSGVSPHREVTKICNGCRSEITIEIELSYFRHKKINRAAHLRYHIIESVD